MLLFFMCFWESKSLNEFLIAVCFLSYSCVCVHVCVCMRVCLRAVLLWQSSASDYAPACLCRHIYSQPWEVFSEIIRHLQWLVLSITATVSLLFSAFPVIKLICKVLRFLAEAKFHIPTRLWGMHFIVCGFFSIPQFG